MFPVRAVAVRQTEISSVHGTSVPWCRTVQLQYSIAVGSGQSIMSLAERRKAKALEEAVPAQAVKLNGRSTRGQRISDLQGEDAEADETFWGQGAWQEADDSEFSSEEGALLVVIMVLTWALDDDDGDSGGSGH